MENPYIEALKVAQETIEIHRSQVMALNTKVTNLEYENDLLKKLLDKHHIKYSK